jgi:hypothetical protein
MMSRDIVHEEIQVQPGPSSAAIGTTSSRITALHCYRNLRLTKSYTLVGGRIVEEGYCRAKWFGHTVHQVNNLEDLHKLVVRYESAQDTCLIRGVPIDDLPVQVQRKGINFPMQEGGARWICLDFDGIALPACVDPYGPGGIEYAVAQLPHEFHTASYLAQFSASAGILNADGTPYKPGLRAHVFFWLDRATTNEELKGWLFDYPVDLAVFTPVQPHYICNPVLGEGVDCAITSRLYLNRKSMNAVSVPDLSSYLPPAQGKNPSVADWTDPQGGLPTLDDLLTCEFIDWYLSNPHPEGERYEQTRAFAHNLRRVATDDWETLLEHLIPADFPYADTIIKSAQDSRPITCEHIHRCAYRCHQFDPATGTCRINRHAKTPYGLARWMKGALVT